MYRLALKKEHLEVVKDNKMLYSDRANKWVKVGTDVSYELSPVIKEWLKENIEGCHVHIGEQPYIVFENEENALLFKLTWY